MMPTPEPTIPCSESATNMEQKQAAEVIPLESNTSPQLELATQIPNPETETKIQDVIGMGEGTWYCMEEAVVGLAHRAKNLPCQDAAQAVHKPRPVLVVADGAGSSAVSEIGARTVVQGTVRLLDTLSKPMTELLDGDVHETAVTARTWGLLLVKHAVGMLKDLANQHRRELRDFRCTLLVMVAGKQRLLWIKVGDGALVLERMQGRQNGLDMSSVQWEPILNTVGGLGKGEFVNQTQFLDRITPDEVEVGCVDIAGVTGMAIMSDGAAERLVSIDGQQVSSRIATLLQQLRSDKLRRQTLTKMFYSQEFCEHSTGDDRSIALAARAFVSKTS